MKAFYDKKPSKLEAVNNGSYLYHYNVQEQDNQWVCEEVIVWSPISSNKLTQLVIADKWDSNYEQKLINEYNGVQMGMYSEEDSAIITTKYKKFLEERIALKKIVDEDCKELNIQ